MTSRVETCNHTLMRLHETRVKCNQAKRVTPFHGRLLSLDPGETTGFAVWRSDPDKIVLERCGQLDSRTIDKFNGEALHYAIFGGVDHVVYERYSVYAHKAQQHVHSDVPTLRVIGSIETLCAQLGLSNSQQTAQVAKGFCTDDFLKRMYLWVKGMKHARDAIRHGAYFMFFGPPNS